MTLPTILWHRHYSVNRRQFQEIIYLCHNLLLILTTFFSTNEVSGSGHSYIACFQTANLNTLLLKVLTNFLIYFVTYWTSKIQTELENSNILWNEFINTRLNILKFLLLILMFRNLMLNTFVACSFHPYILFLFHVISVPGVLYSLNFLVLVPWFYHYFIYVCREENKGC